MPSREFKRTDRVAALLRRELGTLVHQQVRDHALPSASVSDVEVSRDLDLATIWVTVLDKNAATVAVEALNAMASELRRQLARRVRLRRTPELRFRYDGSVDAGERIEALLRAAAPPAAEP